MARMKKIDELKKKQTTVTLPVSLYNYVANDGDLMMSKLLQTAIADNVLGSVSMQLREEFWKTYSDSNNYSDRFKLSTLTDEYIRMARWILESEIMEVSIVDDRRVAIKVVWNISGAVKTVLVDFSRSAFHHVIYDEVLSVTPERNTIFSDKKSALEELAFLYRVNEFKYFTLMTWINNSWEGK